MFIFLYSYPRVAYRICLFFWHSYPCVAYVYVAYVLPWSSCITRHDVRYFNDDLKWFLLRKFRKNEVDLEQPIDSTLYSLFSMSPWQYMSKSNVNFFLHDFNRKIVINSGCQKKFDYSKNFSFFYFGKVVQCFMYYGRQNKYSVTLKKIFVVRKQDWLCKKHP